MDHWNIRRIPVVSGDNAGCAGAANSHEGVANKLEVRQCLGVRCCRVVLEYRWANQVGGHHRTEIHGAGETFLHVILGIVTHARANEAARSVGVCAQRRWSTDRCPMNPRAEPSFFDQYRGAMGGYPRAIEF
jgi:hypothetical protein